MTLEFDQLNYNYNYMAFEQSNELYSITLSGAINYITITFRCQTDFYLRDI